jgi:hypothetical protein
VNEPGATATRTATTTIHRSAGIGRVLADDASRAISTEPATPTGVVASSG